MTGRRDAIIMKDRTWMEIVMQRLSKVSSAHPSRRIFARETGNWKTFSILKVFHIKQPSSQFYRPASNGWARGASFLESCAHRGVLQLPSSHRSWNSTEVHRSRFREAGCPTLGILLTLLRRSARSLPCRPLVPRVWRRQMQA